ncbi:MAG TPA: alpha-2-macroglobulin [Hyphomicrobiales bacterium]|nr:alpha-2-macroglobulin [Hyphomicrobiales bacterium]
MWRLVAVAAGIVAMAGAALAATKDYRPRDLVAGSLKLEAELTREAAKSDSTASQALAAGIADVRQGNWRAAMTDLAVAAGLDPRSEQAWRNYAVALLRLTPAKNENAGAIVARGGFAAYEAYLLSPDPKGEARALALIGESYSRREEWRPSIDALKASLDRFEQPEVRAAYTKVREAHGFRVVNYTVDSDAASPRACVQFSEKLAPGRRDFSPFVAVQGIDKPAVTAKGDQLCIDGLAHGEHYKVTVRAGLPSAVGEDLLKSHDLVLYVRDRSPSVRFTGRNYVLPRTGQQGLPLVSVNTERVAVEIFRVNDRGLVPEIVGGDFQRQLDGSAIDTLRSTSGAEVFKGELQVQNRLNADVATAFPLDDAMKAMAPGAYVMVAWPVGATPQDYASRATQWFVVSDLGLTALTGSDGLHALVRSLASAAPLKDVDLRLIARNNAVLGHATTDSAGFASFPAGLTRGGGGNAPALLVAEAPGGDYGFLSLTQPGFDLSDRGVGGRAAPGPLDADLFAERGVYRPGETVHLTALLRNPSGAAVEHLPLTLVVQRPDGVEDRRATVADQGAGGRTLDVPLLAQAEGGTWRVKAYADPKGDPIGETSFLVADYVPERLAMTLSTAATALGSTPATVEVQGDWLYGAPAADLGLEGEIAIGAAAAPPGAPAGYRFGLADETLPPQRTTLDNLPKTDAKGHAAVAIERPPLPATTHPLEAKVTLRLREPGGRTLERALTLPVASDRAFIGVKPLFNGPAGEGETARFAVKVMPGKAAMPKTLKWELSRLTTRFQWYSTDGRWQFDSVEIASRVANGTLRPDQDGAGSIAAKVQYGRYRLDVTTDDASGPATGVAFDAGWYEAAASADTPDLLDVALDKAMYRPGDKATIRIAPRFAGKATVMVVSDKVLASTELDVPAGGASVALPVTEAWRPGAYAVVFLHRPLDAGASRMPGRAVGIAFAKIDPAPKTLAVALGLPAKAEPRQVLDVPVTIGNVGPRETAYVVAAAVDVGILNLTDYQPPAPDARAFGQRRLGVDIRDLYGQLIDGMQAARGRIRNGGDEGAPSFAETPTQAPLALFSGIVKVGPDGKATIPFALPAFNGTVKVMVAAWSADKLGHASADVVVADPVVLTGTLPRFLALGDRSRFLVDLANVSGPAGDYSLAVTPTGGSVALDDPAPRTVRLAAGGHADLALPLAARALGRTDLAVTLSGPGGQRYEQGFALTVEPAEPVRTKRIEVALPPGTGTLTVSSDMLADFLPETASVAVSAGPRDALAPAAYAQALRDYPFSCSEQLSSRLVAALDLTAAGLAQPAGLRDEVATMVEEVLARQDSAGGFGLWAPGEDDLWLDDYVTDVLSRVRERGYPVSERALTMALDHLRSTIGIRTEDASMVAPEVIYAQYVLARNGRGLMGDLRYLADARLGDIKTPLARAQLAAALDILGDHGRAGRAFAAAAALLVKPPDDADFGSYGSNLSDSAGVLALAAESDAAIVPTALSAVHDARSDRTGLSTQENAWLLRAAVALKARFAATRLSVDGRAVTGGLSRVVSAADLAKAPLVIANPDTEPAVATLSIRGAPKAPEGAEEAGFKVERGYFTTDGKAVDPAKVAQNTRLVVVLSITEPEPQAGRILVVDHLPAGFEIENPRLVDTGDTGGFSWLPKNELPPVHTEFRDDRFVAAFTRTGDDDEPVLTAAYVVRAVVPGGYALPPATAEDMYRPDRHGQTASGHVEVTPGR